jgi:hypothetical protein
MRGNVIAQQHTAFDSIPNQPPQLVGWYLVQTAKNSNAGPTRVQGTMLRGSDSK